MNNNNTAAVQTGAARGGGPAPRGRGHGSSNRGRGGRVTPSVTRSKVGPNRLLEADWVGDAALKVQSFTIWLGAGQASAQQWTFHRPIGQTKLDERAWVATPTRDIAFLLARKGNEETSAWERKSQLAKRQAVLTSRTGRGLASDGQTEVWTAAGTPPIQETIRTCMSAAEAAGAQRADWLQFAPQAVQDCERAFKNTLKTQGVPADWLRDNPKPAFETRGGPLGDQEQKEVGYLKGSSLQAAQDKVLNVLIGRVTNDTVEKARDDEDAADESDSDDDAAEGEEDAE